MQNKGLRLCVHFLSILHLSCQHNNIFHVCNRALLNHRTPRSLSRRSLTSQNRVVFLLPPTHNLCTCKNTQFGLHTLDATELRKSTHLYDGILIKQSFASKSFQSLRLFLYCEFRLYGPGCLNSQFRNEMPN